MILNSIAMFIGVIGAETANIWSLNQWEIKSARFENKSEETSLKH